jgi:hypothetical protein
MERSEHMYEVSTKALKKAAKKSKAEHPKRFSKSETNVALSIFFFLSPV